ncbi:hypothetical protein J437_LFUL008319 [Ladona fulva]|uniref:Uncharacterized protein n=1 Tax=Ladona fulva TaxID=123851 RepID=A0A8K0KAD7_LADFU|nr:hypothetical protein J437_LFUL008319 [Ladona fulva]
MQWTGFFTTSKIAQFLENLKGYVSSRQIPWAAIHVSGFEDSPVYSDLVEHRWYGAFADISYTIFFHPSGKFILYDLSSSQKILKYQ